MVGNEIDIETEFCFFFLSANTVRCGCSRPPGAVFTVHRNVRTSATSTHHMPTRWLGCLVIVAIALLSAAAQWALSSVQESAAFELESLAIAASSQPCAGASSCHAAGYCDRSVCRCICLPGWTGARCDATLLGACRMGEHGIAAPCEGFAGVMSCQCRQACSVLHAVYGTNAPARSGAYKAVCWTSDASDELDTSSLPPNASVHFWAPHRNWQVNRGAD